MSIKIWDAKRIVGIRPIEVRPEKTLPGEITCEDYLFCYFFSWSFVSSIIASVINLIEDVVFIDEIAIEVIFEFNIRIERSSHRSLNADCSHCG